MLYGQGLQDDSSTLSGYVKSPGTKYTMYTIPFTKMLQPRLGTTWAYNGEDTLYASYARYCPGVNSLPRAASWDRSIQNAFVDVYFDQTGTSYGSRFVESSSGKLFVEDMTPRRTTDEFLVGTAQQFEVGPVRSRVLPLPRKHAISGRTPTTPRAWRMPRRRGSPKELYIPNLSAQLAQIGSGSTYVIAELDGAYTKFYEVTLEAEWRSSKAFVSGSYSLQPLLGQLRPGQHHDGQRRQHLHRVVLHRRRRRPPALELQGRHAARRPPAPVQGVRLLHAALGRQRRRLRRRPVGPAVGEVELRALPRADHEHERRLPVRGAGRVAPVAVALAARPQLHAELPRREVDEPPGRG